MSEENFHSSVYEHNDQGKFKCKRCSKVSGNAGWAGKHYLECEEFDESESDRKKLLNQEKDYRENHSEKGKQRTKKYNQSDRGQATRKAWRTSAKGRLSQKKCLDRYCAKYPWLRKARLAALKLLGKIGHRFKKNYRVNHEFKRQFHQLLKSERFKKGLRNAEFFPEKIIEMGMLKGQINITKYSQIVGDIKNWFCDTDSSAANYIYLLCDPELWYRGMTFNEFLDSIFYVGRGVGCRFLDHTREVQFAINDGVEFDPEEMPKQSRIEDIWAKGTLVNVICVDLDQRAEETDFAEFSINAFLGSKLTNKKWDGVSRTPTAFGFEEVCESALHYLASGFNNIYAALLLNLDDDFGEKPIYSVNQD